MNSGGVRSTSTSSVRILNEFPTSDVMSGSIVQSAGTSSVQVVCELRTVYSDRHALAQLIGIILRDENVAKYLESELRHTDISDEESETESVVRVLWELPLTRWLKDLEEIIKENMGEVPLAFPVRLRGVADGVNGGRTSYLTTTVGTLSVRIRLSARDGQLVDVADLRGRKVWVMGLIWKGSPLSITAAAISI